jgi:hypothetical protein
VKWAAETYRRLVLICVSDCSHFMVVARLSRDHGRGAKHFILVDCVDAIAVVGAEAIRG